MMFSGTQRVIAQSLYSLLASLTPEARAGAALALATLVLSTEDGFISLNNEQPRVDFFVQCYDVLLSTSLALKMLRDDGLVTETAPEDLHVKDYYADAEFALDRVEKLFSRMPKLSETVN